MSTAAKSVATCCIVYTTDPTYLFPTLVSAMQARLFSSRQKADVAVFCLHLDPATNAVFAPICAREGIHLIPLESDVVEGQLAMIARLFLTRFVPAHYTDYLYLDGDIHILDSLDPLLEFEVPDGCFLAANDPMTFLLADNSFLSRKLRGHLRQLGLNASESLQYFNSGVLRIRAKGWEQIGLEAWQQFNRPKHRSRFPDQDALNLAGKGRRLPLSLTWNYPVFMRHSRVETDIKPRIKHFMSSPKPWNGAFSPWTRAECAPYDQAIEQYPALLPFRPQALSFRSRALYQLQQNGKRAIEMVSWGMSKRRDRILQYEAACSSLSSVYPEPLALDASRTHPWTSDSILPTTVVRTPARTG